jgi:hypothetical protein
VSSSLLEIVELANGDFVLQRASGEGEPLVNIHFSDESKAYIADVGIEVARVMIQAGIQAVAYLNEDQSHNTEESNPEPKRMLH